MSFHLNILIAAFMLLGLVLYTYLLYPLILLVSARLVRRRGNASASNGTPSISIVMTAFNEAARIGRRIEELNCLIDACGLQAELIIVSDGSTDATVEIARGYESDGVRVISLLENVGKAAALSEACKVARNELIVFADVRQRWASDTLDRLIENFSDPRIGAVSGELLLEKAPGVTAGVGLYWRYEKWLRNLEGRVGSVVGVSGSIAAVRRPLFKAIPAGTILDDVYWPLCVAMQGYRVVHDPRARAYDRLPSRSGDEFRRKVRTLCGNFQLVARLPSVIVPWRNPIWWQFMSHKLCRLAVPWALLGLLVISASIGTFAGACALLLQLLGYAAGLIGLVLGQRCTFRLASAASAFLLLNAAAWLAFWVWITGRAERSWTKVAYTIPATSTKSSSPAVGWPAEISP